MLYLLALVPIFTVLGLMLVLRWGAHKAGLAGLIAGLIVAFSSFGLTWPVLWVSQIKGIQLSLFVLAVMWPALFLYHWVDANKGISAIAHWLEQTIPDRGMCLILLAWALSGLLEGLAGFGLPIAVVAPMLVALGISPVRAVAAVAIGHAWSVTFGDMGVIFQTLVAIVNIEARLLVPWAALLLGIACLACGLLTALVLEQRRQWLKVVGISLVMGLVQAGLAKVDLLPLSAFGAGLSGMLVYIGYAKACACQKVLAQPASGGDSGASNVREQKQAASLAIATYGGLALMMAAITLVPALRNASRMVAWVQSFPEVATSTGFITAPAKGPVFRPLAHPGSLIIIAALLSIVGVYRSKGSEAAASAHKAFKATLRSAWLPTLGILFMMGLSVLMDHCGMSLLLAKGLSRTLGGFYPVVSTWVGILGAFATGSNNNSNVLFGCLQKSVAELLNIQPPVLIASQTAGGSLGSMLAPAKIVVGCSTVGIVGQEGQVMRRTLVYGLLLGLGLGIVTLVLSRI